MQSSLIEWLTVHTWPVEVVAALISLLLLNFGLKKLLAKQKRTAHVKEGSWLYHLDYAALVPAQVLLSILLGCFLIDLAIREFSGASISLAVVRNVGIVICLAWFFLRWKKVVHRTLMAHQGGLKHSYDPLSLAVTGRLFTIGVVFLTSLIVLQLLGVDIAPLVAFGGIGAAALGFASKDVIANFFGGVMLSFTRPFTVGDFVELPQKKMSGNVEEIGWYLTSLRDVKKQPIYIPNWLFATELLINQSRISHRCLDERIEIRYDDLSKLTPILKEVRSVLEQEPLLDRKLSHYAHLLEFTSFSVQMELKAYFTCTAYQEFMQVRQKLLLRIHDILSQFGVETPVPITQIVMRESVPS